MTYDDLPAEARKAFARSIRNRVPPEVILEFWRSLDAEAEAYKRQLLDALDDQDQAETKRKSAST